MSYEDLVITLKGFKNLSPEVGFPSHGVLEKALQFLYAIRYRFECPKFSVSSNVNILAFLWENETELVDVHVVHESDSLGSMLIFSRSKVTPEQTFNSISLRDESRLGILQKNLKRFPYKSTKTWKDLKPCPFCGWKMHDEDEVLTPTGLYWQLDELGHEVYFSHDQINTLISNGSTRADFNPIMEVHCAHVSGGCGATIQGCCIDEAVDKWNRRV